MSNLIQQLKDSLTPDGSDFKNPAASGGKKTGKSKELQLEENLQEIFLHYSKMHLDSQNKPHTFDKIKREVKMLSLHEFIKFCKDFKINVGQQKVVTVFKRVALQALEMYYEQFKEGLT
jgi:hypothetical protein